MFYMSNFWLHIIFVKLNFPKVQKDEFEQGYQCLGIFVPQQQQSRFFFLSYNVRIQKRYFLNSD